MKKFYITSAIPYVNAKPHIGHALEFVQTDVIARYNRLIGNDVLKLCGGDENAIKNVQAAEKAGLPIQKFIDDNNDLFLDLTKKINASYDIWQKGSNQSHHFVSSQKLWKLCIENINPETGEPDIYKKSYTGLYCIGCELFYGKDELNENDECFEHPGKKLEEITEENYFFRLSRYQNQILDLIKTNKLEIIPNKRKNEILAFIEKGLQDISISRSNLRAKGWGVPVPGDNSQKIYVWFDALNIYQSGIGFGWDEDLYNKWWPADMHVIGKGIIRFHAVYWPAFLISAKLLTPKKLFVHEYFTVNGQKMSKTLGNVVDPLEMIEKYSTDGLRLYFLKHFSPFQDGDFSEKKLKEAYNADLANGLGNLVARVAKLCEKNDIEGIKDYSKNHEDLKNRLETVGYSVHWKNFEFNLILDLLWREIKDLDIKINQEEPWKKSNEELIKTGSLNTYSKTLLSISQELKPFLPEISEKIEKQFTTEKIKSQPPLFPRIT